MRPSLAAATDNEGLSKGYFGKPRDVGAIGCLGTVFGMGSADEREETRAPAAQAGTVAWAPEGTPWKRLLRAISGGRWGHQPTGWTVIRLDAPWQDTPSSERPGWRERAANLADSVAFAVDYIVCVSCGRGWVEQPYTMEKYQRCGLAAAGQAQTAGLGQGCITVGHEGLPGRRCRCRNPHRARRPSPISRLVIREVRHQPPWTRHLGAVTSRRRWAGTRRPFGRSRPLSRSTRFSTPLSSRWSKRRFRDGGRHVAAGRRRLRRLVRGIAAYEAGRPKQVPSGVPTSSCQLRNSPLRPEVFVVDEVSLSAVGQVQDVAFGDRAVVPSLGQPVV